MENGIAVIHQADDPKLKVDDRPEKLLANE